MILTHFLSDELQVFFPECTDLSLLFLVFSGMRFLLFMKQISFIPTMNGNASTISL